MNTPVPTIIGVGRAEFIAGNTLKVDLSANITDLMWKRDYKKASARQSGYLSKEDWTIFDAKGEPYTLPVASDLVLGGVKIGSGINEAADGTISVSTSAIDVPVVDVEPSALAGRMRLFALSSDASTIFIKRPDGSKTILMESQI